MTMHDRPFRNTTTPTLEALFKGFEAIIVEAPPDHGAITCALLAGLVNHELSIRLDRTIDLPIRNAPVTIPTVVKSIECTPMIESLAERLFEVFATAAGRTTSWEYAGGTRRGYWRSVALEVHRQMEWSRRHPRPLYMEPDTMSEIVGYAPLVLAPLTWDPLLDPRTLKEL